MKTPDFRKSFTTIILMVCGLTLSSLSYAEIVPINSAEFNTTTATASKGNPVILSKSNQNLLSLNGRNEIGYLYVHNGNNTPTNGFKIVALQSQDNNASPIIINQNPTKSTCFTKVAAKGECRFELSFQGTGKSEITKPVWFRVIGEDGTDYFQVNAIDMPAKHFYRPDLLATAAHGVDNNLMYIASTSKVDTSVTYAATIKGVYKSTDHGATWVAQNNGLSGNKLVVNHLLFNNNVLFAGTNDGVVKWDPNQLTWVPYGKGLEGKQVDSLIVAGNDFYVGVALDYGTAYKYNNSKDQWEQQHSGLLNQGTKVSLGYVNNELFIGLDDDVYKWSGKQWVSTKLNKGPVWMVATFAKNLYVSTDFKGIFKWNASTQKWEDFNNGIHLTDFTSFPTFATINGNFYVGLYPNGVMRWDSSTHKWIKQNFGPAGDYFVQSLLADSDYLYLTVTTGNRIYRALEKTMFSQALNINLDNIGVSSLLYSAAKGELYLSDDHSHGVLKSSDQGANWVFQSNNFKPQFCDALTEYNNNLFVATWGKPDSGVFQWDGTTWRMLGDQPLQGVSALAFLRGTLYASQVSDRPVYTRIEYLNGSSWRSAGVINAAQVKSLLVFNDGIINKLYAGSDIGIFVFDIVWQKISNHKVSVLAKLNNKFYVGTQNGGVFKKNGKLWDDLSKGLLEQQSVNALVALNNVFYSGVGNIKDDNKQGVYVKSGSSNWTFLGLADQYVSSLVTIGNKLFVGTSDYSYIAYKKAGLFVMSSN